MIYSVKIPKILNGLPWNIRIQVLRTTKGWSQEKAALKCGTSRRIYWNWENGKNKPLRSNRMKIARVFNVTVNDIFMDD